MSDSFSAFRRIARDRLDAAAVDISTGNENVRLFNDSLASAMAHITLKPAPVDPGGEPLSIVAGYIETLIPNAVADHDDGVHLIAMNNALFVAIHEFAMFCFTQRDFFPDVGDPSLEVSPAPLDESVPGLWLLNHTKRGGHVEERHGQTITPKGKSRYVASIYLAMLMCRYVWLHEFEHCFNGHVRFVQETGRSTRLFEVAERMELISVASDAEHEAWREQRCLEFDADQSAFWASCRIQMDERENIEGIAALPRDLRLRLTLFGAYSMTWLFDEIQAYLDARHGLTHPAPFLRLQHLFRIAATNLAPISARFEALNNQACAAFDAIALAVPGAYKSHDLYAGMRDAATQATLSDYADQLEQLRPRLQRYRYASA